MSTKMKNIWKGLIKQHGEEGLYMGSSAMTTFTDVVSSGSFLLDDALGIWGFPMGRIIQFAGQESSGKTFMSLVTISEYQRKNPEGWAIFIDAEYSFDQAWAKSLGVDLDRLFIYRENSGKKIFELLVGKPSKTSPNKKAKLGLLDLEISEPSGLGYIVLDSVAAITPPQEETSAVGKQNMALIARFLPPELRCITPLLTKSGVTFIGINQVRVDPGVMFGNPETSTGGRAWKHYCSMMLNFARIRAKDSAILDENDVQIGHHVRVKVEKNKLAPAYREAEIAILYTKGVIDKNKEIRDLGAKYGVIERPNNKTWVLDGEKYNGKDAIAEALLDLDMQASVLERVKEVKIKSTSFTAPVRVEKLEELEDLEELE